MPKMLEKRELRELKFQAAEKLKRLDVKSYHLKKTDDRLNIYARSVIDNPDGHNLYELLALLRFFRFLDTYIFRPKEVRKYIVFYESLKFSGVKGRTKYKLTPIQVFQFANILGF